MAASFDYRARARRLQKKLSASGIGAAVTGGLSAVGANSVYFGEESFPAIIVFTPDKAVLYSTGGENPAFDETIPYRDFRKHLPKLLKKEKARKVGVDERSDLSGITFFLKKHKAEPAAFGRKIEELREIKDAGEIRLIQQAARASAEIIEAQRPFGKTEHRVAGEMELAARTRGFALDAFPPIVASGANSASPHALVSSKKILPGDCVVVDAGVRVGWYCGDCSRTFYGGKDKQIKDAIEAAKEAKKAAERKAKPGTRGNALAEAAQRVIHEYGFGDQSFRRVGLSLGHQVGLRVHEGRGLEKVVLAKGMAFTIEPGVYVPKKFGTRFEDVFCLPAP